MDYIIFSIDNWYDIHTLAKFTRHVDTLRSMGKLKGAVTPLISSYEDKPEISFICTVEDFDTHIDGAGYMINQESYMYVSSDKHMTAKVVDKHFETLKSGRLSAVNALTASDEASWSYRPDLNQYYILK